MASSATSILGKRQHDGTHNVGEPSTSFPRLYNYYVLEPESSCPSEEDTESVHSIQDKTTDSAKDTPDTSSTEEEGSLSDNDDNVQEEYEPRSLSESDIRHPFTINESFSTSSNDEDFMIKKGKIIKGVTENTSSTTTSSSDDSPDRIDPELSLTDYWFCVKCRTPNNNPLFRFCEKCFGDRKNFFPPRPKITKKRRKQRIRRKVKSAKMSEIEGNSSTSQQPNSSFPISLNSTDELTSSQSTTKGTQSSNVSEVENTSWETVPSRSITCQTESSEQWPLYGETCETCMARPKDGVFIHTKIVHRYSCYRCSKKIWKEIGRCPLCNNKVCNVKKIVG